MNYKGEDKLVFSQRGSVGCSASLYSLFSWQHISVMERMLRLAIFGTFIGHGYFALGVKPGWIPLITTFGFSTETAVQLLPVIGIQDMVIAFIVLVFPARGVLVWAAVWALAAGLSRPIAGEHIAEFIERAGNWAAPLALLMIQGFPKSIPELFKVS